MSRIQLATMLAAALVLTVAIGAVANWRLGALAVLGAAAIVATRIRYAPAAALVLLAAMLALATST